MPYTAKRYSTPKVYSWDVLTRDDELVTFDNRNQEPYRLLLMKMVQGDSGYRSCSSGPSGWGFTQRWPIAAASRAGSRR